MNKVLENISINRYPGVKPFSISEDFMFFGRETDIEALNSLIYVNQTVILYGKSGYGKSSLINAGIIPRLQKNEEWDYFSIRFNNFSEKEAEKSPSPLQTTRQRLSENLIVEKNNLLDTLMPNEGSFWYWIKQNQLHTRKGKFIIFFDQFEELFTYSKEQIEELSEQLSQLLYTTLPVGFKKKLASFVDDNGITNEQHDFLYEKPDVKIIISIRADRLSLLNLLKDKLPTILQNSYELDALSIEGAISAIIKPATLPQQWGFITPNFSFTEEAINKIIGSLANSQDGKIEAATLQIVCRFIEDTLVASRKLLVINENDFGDFTDIFQQYYQGILNRLSEVEKNKAQHLIEDELIDGNRRNPLSVNYIKNKFGISDNLLLQLEQSSLLRKERDASGRILYEVSHDSLVSAIERVASGRRQYEDNLKKRELEEQVIEERRRAQLLLELTNKARARSKIAIALSIVCFAMTIWAIVLLRKANDSSQIAINEKKNAKKMEQSALENEKLAVKAQYEAEKATAKLFLEKGDAYFNEFGDDGVTEAKIYYDSASKYMMKYQSDTLFQIISQKLILCKKKLQ